MVVVAVLLAAARQEEMNLPKAELRLVRAIKDKNWARLLPFVDGPVRLRSVSNIYGDHDAVLKKRFSEAQLSRLWKVEIEFGTLRRGMSATHASKLLKMYSHDIGSGLDTDMTWRPNVTKSGRNGDIVAKIASGAYYDFELQYPSRNSPKIIRLFDVDHLKTWPYLWTNTGGPD